MKNKTELLREVTNDYDRILAAGPDAFESEDEWQEELAELFGIMYALEASLQGELPDY